MLTALWKGIKAKALALTSGVLLIVILASWGIFAFAWTKSKLAAKKQTATIAALTEELGAIHVAAALQQARVDAVCALADKDWDQASRHLAALQAEPLPKTPEAARVWALRALREGK